MASIEFLPEFDHGGGELSNVPLFPGDPGEDPQQVESLGDLGRFEGLGAQVQNVDLRAVLVAS